MHGTKYTCRLLSVVFFFSESLTTFIACCNFYKDFVSFLVPISFYLVVFFFNLPHTAKEK